MGNLWANYHEGLFFHKDFNLALVKTGYNCTVQQINCNIKINLLELMRLVKNGGSALMTEEW